MGSSPLSQGAVGLILVVGCLLSALPAQANQDASLKFHTRPTLLGKFAYPSAAFSNVLTVPSQSGARRGAPRYDLLLSSFGLTGSDVSVVQDVGRFFKNVSAIVPVSLTKSMKWPNQVAPVPEQALGGQTPYLAIPDGFLVPTKGAGSVTLQEVNGGATHVISSGQGDWFYHRVVWADMDKDGRLDALTCGAHKPLFGSAQGRLVYFQNPDGHSVSSPWKDHVIASGPDVLFRLGNLTIPGQTMPKEVIVTTEFFNPRLRIFWSESPRDDWSDPSMIKFRDIDHVPGPMGTGAPFDALVEDLNQDGKHEIVVTFNDAKNGTVVIYEVPDDFRTGVFKRHVVASGYAAETSAPNSGGPGLLTLLPGRNATSKPVILVSGDDSGILSTLEPARPTDPNDWTYKRTDILYTQKSTMGGVSVLDFDGDGRLEIFAPSYEQGAVYVFRV